MNTAGEARIAPSTCRWRRWLRRRRTGGRRVAAIGGVTPVAAWPAPPAEGSCWVIARSLLPRRGSGSLVDDRLGGLLTVGLRLLDVTTEDGLIDHLDPRAVVVVEEGVLDDAIGRLALGHHLPEDLVGRIERRVDLVHQIGADGD